MSPGIDVASLARDLAPYVTATLPVIMKGGKVVLDGFLKQIGGEMWRSLWERLRGRIEQKPAALEALTAAAADREDEDAQAALRFLLRNMLEEDSALAAETDRFLRNVSPSGSAFAWGPSASATVVNLTLQAPAGERKPEDRQPQPARGIEAYLRWIIATSSAIPVSAIEAVLSGQDSNNLVPLDAVYTSLTTRSPPSDRLVPAVEQLNRHKHLVLVGEPGSGKSTFTNLLALCFAGELIGHSRFNLSLLENPSSEGPDGAGRPAKWKDSALLPLRVALRDFSSGGIHEGVRGHSARDLWTFVEHALEGAGLRDCSSLLEDRLHRQGGMLLLDGLDEVPEEGRRRERVSDLVRSFADAYPQCRILVTCRTQAYRDLPCCRWRLPGFREAAIQPFSREQIGTFATRWYRHREQLGQLGPAETRNGAQRLKTEILGSPRLLALAERPLLLTLMATLHLQRGSLPHHKERVYAAVVDLLLDSWERSRTALDLAGGRQVENEPGLAQWLAANRSEILSVLQELAFESHRSQPTLCRKPVEMTTGLSEGQLLDGLATLRSVSEEGRWRLLSYLRSRCGLLVAQGDGRYTFPHVGFREYLAACHLSDHRRYPDIVGELVVDDPERWREVVQLAAGKVASGTIAALWDLAVTLCCTEHSDTYADSGREWGAFLSARILSEFGDVSRIPERHRELPARLVRWLLRLLGSRTLTAPDRAQAGLDLARFGDPRFDPNRGHLLRDPSLGFQEVLVSGAEVTRTHLSSDGSDAAEVQTFYMARFPVTVAQFADFVISSGQPLLDSKCLDGSSHQPVSRVTWYESMAYCQWLDAQLRGPFDSAVPSESELGGRLKAGFRIGLPSANRWELAARGHDGRTYPWGSELDRELFNGQESGIGSRSTVGCFPDGRSPAGCEEMSGNIAEWTSSFGDTTLDRQVRGGSFRSPSWEVECTAQASHDASKASPEIGFRIALLPPYDYTRCD